MNIDPRVWTEGLNEFGATAGGMFLAGMLLFSTSTVHLRAYLLRLRETEPTPASLAAAHMIEKEIERRAAES